MTSSASTDEAGRHPNVSDHLRWGFRLVWRGKWLIAAVGMVVLGLAVAYLWRSTPLYTAQVTLVIDAVEPVDAPLERDPARFRLTEANVATEVEVIHSASLAARVIERLGLEDDPEFNAALRPPTMLRRFREWLAVDELLRSAFPDRQEMPEQAREQMRRSAIVGTFLSRLNVRNLRRSYVINLQFTSESRQKAALVANTVADMYVLERLEAGLSEARQTSAWLSRRLDELRREVLAAERAAEDYRAEHGLRQRDSRQNSVTEQQLTELNSRLVLARAELAQRQARLRQVQSLSGSRSVDTSADVLQSPLIQRLREQEATLLRELSEIGRTYGDNHPRIIGIKADLGELDRKIDQEIRRIAASLSNEVDVASAGVRALQGELSALSARTDTARSSEIRLRELEREAEASQHLYETFLARFKRDAEQERIQRSNARIVAAANIPTGASHPRTLRVLAGALLTSILLGVGLVFLLDRLDDKVRSADDAERVTGLQTLAMLPRHRGKRADAVIAEEPRSRLADAVRNLRNALLARPFTGSGGRVVAVTSSIPEEGKSFVGLSLARLLGRSGGRVLLIDADLHRPRQHLVFDRPRGPGLVDVLNGRLAPADAILADVDTGLSLLPAGESEGTAEDILGVPDLLRRLKADYDWIIVDGPPMLAISDARVLAGNVDNVIYLVRWGHTSRDAVRNGIRIARDSGAPLLGVAVSMVDTRRHARYGYADYGTQYERYRAYYSS